MKSHIPKKLALKIKMEVLRENDNIFIPFPTY